MNIRWKIDEAAAEVVATMVALTSGGPGLLRHTIDEMQEEVKLVLQKHLEEQED